MDFTPTSGILATTVNTYKFLFNHKKEFLKVTLIYGSLMVCLAMISFQFLQYMMDRMMETRFENPDNNFISVMWWFNIGLEIVETYIFAAIAISWHRLVIFGRDKYQRMFILMPRKSEFMFIFAIMALIGCYFAMFMGLAFIPWHNQYIPHYVFVPILMLIPILIITIIYFKISFYFPAKAAEHKISLSQNIKLTKGYFWKLSLSLLLVCIPVILVMLGYMFGVVHYLMQFVMQHVHVSGPPSGFPAEMILMQLIMVVPLMFFFYPLYVVLGVTVVSNYYLHALEKHGFKKKKKIEPKPDDFMYDDFGNEGPY